MDLKVLLSVATVVAAMGLASARPQEHSQTWKGLPTMVVMMQLSDDAANLKEEQSSSLSTGESTAGRPSLMIIRLRPVQSDSTDSRLGTPAIDALAKNRSNDRTDDDAILKQSRGTDDSNVSVEKSRTDDHNSEAILKMSPTDLDNTDFILGKTRTGVVDEAIPTEIPTDVSGSNAATEDSSRGMKVSNGYAKDIGIGTKMNLIKSSDHPASGSQHVPTLFIRASDDGTASKSTSALGSDSELERPSLYPRQQTLLRYAHPARYI
ncbi:uncharacterized protein [Venturia canescens]|uniref:uncharacterized protein n=1 Tax=Venturia canescens TaxID=32260 RepID=UPI001C9D3EED|nr:uncharacterized protein LOC122416075 [Venturia canescens]